MDMVAFGFEGAGIKDDSFCEVTGNANLFGESLASYEVAGAIAMFQSAERVIDDSVDPVSGTAIPRETAPSVNKEQLDFSQVDVVTLPDPLF